MNLEEIFARQRNFMNFVMQKYPHVYREFCEVETENERQMKEFQESLRKKKGPWEL